MISRIKKEWHSLQLIKADRRIAEAVFTFAIVLELIVMMTDHLASWTLPYRGRVTHVAFILFCIKILMTRYDYKQVILIIIMGILGTISYVTCRDEYVIRAVVFVAAAVGADVGKNLRIIFLGTLIGSLVIISFSLLGICGDIVDIRHYGRGMVEARYCLGFNHANNVHCLFWYLLTIYILYKRKINKQAIIVLMITNLLLYYLTRSRTGVLIIGITLIGTFCLQSFSKVFNRNLLAMTAILELVIAIVTTMYAAVSLAMRIPVISTIDRLLTGRLEMVSERAYVELWSMWPAARPSPEVDNAFAGITYSYGMIIGVLLILTVLFCICYGFIKNDRQILLIVIMVIGMIYMESTFIFNISLLCNMLLILLWSGVYVDNRKLTND